MKEMQELNLKFNNIKSLGWIPAINNRNNSCGVLFEELLGKPIENFEIPDYKGIEIKTHTVNSNCYITLFNANPEGKHFFEINRICDTYGYSDAILKECKILNGDISCTKKTKIGENFKFRLLCHFKERKIQLIIYDINDKIVDKDSFWDFDILKEKLYRKLTTLAYINVNKKYIGRKLYFKYESIIFYHLRDFSTFLSLIKSGKIVISFSVGVFRMGPRKGQIHNHGVSFRILERHLGDLFTPISGK